MAKRPRKQREPVPSYMQGMERLGKETITESDVVWVGDDGKLEDKMIDAALAGMTTPSSALMRLVIAIIDNHPDGKGVSQDARVEAAMEALIPGSTGGSKKGRKPLVVDERILEVFAREYRARAFGFRNQGRSDADLMEEATMQFLPIYGGWDDESQVEKIKRLKDKFEDTRDARLAAASAPAGIEAERHFLHVKLILDSLAVLGLTKAPPEKG